jgi:hypothetical protein
MKNLQAKIYQNQLMSLAGFSLGSYPLFNGPPQEVMISLNLNYLLKLHYLFSELPLSFLTRRTTCHR